MTKALRIDKSAEEGLKELLKFLLENGKVKGVLTLRKLGEFGAISYSLITNPDGIDSTLPLFPLMPVNLGKQLSLLTLMGAATDPIAVVLRPCELRAFVELVKRNQGSLENFLFISSTCGGVYPLEMAVAGDVEEQLAQYWEAVGQGEAIADIRPACKACTYFAPYTADITLSLLGNKEIDKQSVLLLNTDKGESFVEGISGQLSEEEPNSATMEGIRKEREAERQKLSDEVETKALGIDDLTKTFSRCIDCHNCSKVCPICYCHVCFFDSKDSEHGPVYYETALEKKGCVSMLSGTIFYHLVRLFHVSASCVGCGLCADVCPANIPLWAISLKVGDSVQKAFDYLPGKDMEEGLPITTYTPEEFAQVE
ncbi:MAG: Coenzyme F420 hydrogenase/dehydrogenase, beta subunit C-terminal domain [Dehalococcoidia bacterium]